MNTILFVFLSISFAFAADQFSGRDQMNGISFKDYKDFTEKWKLVTIRFRKDTGEMRLTYANDLAFKTLESGAINYPDGAIFAKTGIYTHTDPQFESSVVPTGIRRYQFMVKNKETYKSSNGWGYGLFDPQGKTFEEDPVTTQQACFACHTMVENRGDVFSQLFNFNKSGVVNFHNGDLPQSRITFDWKKTKELPLTLQKLIPKQYLQVRIVTNSILRKNIFQGTLDEVKPLLEAEVRKSKYAAIFASEDFKKFTLVYSSASDKCMGLHLMVSHTTNLENKVDVKEYCTHD